MESVKRDTERLKEEISGRFREARELLKLSPPELAKAIGSDPQTIRDYENAKSIPGGRALAGLSTLGIDVDYVLTGNGEIQCIPGNHDLMEPSKPYGEAYSLDPLLLQGVLDFFFAWLTENADRVRLDPSRYGAVIAVLYRVASQAGVIRKAELEQVLAIAA